MSKVVLLDSGPLGLLSSSLGVATPCKHWFRNLLLAGVTVYVPEVTDYEVRRELTRMRKAASIARLDALATQARYLPITTTAMRRAAELWASTR